MDTPLCRCHGVLMYWHKNKVKTVGGQWKCRERRKALDAARWQSYYYERMPATVRIQRQLAERRRLALKRRRERQLRSADMWPSTGNGTRPNFDGTGSVEG